MQYREVATIGMAKLKMSQCFSSLQSLAFFSEKALSFILVQYHRRLLQKNICQHICCSDLLQFFLNHWATFPQIKHHFLENYKNKK